MQCQVYSDTHLEHRKNVLPNIAAPNLLAVGDIAAAYQLQSIVPYWCDNYDHIVYVAGNHEYYGSTYQRVQELLYTLDSEYSNFHLLDLGKTVTINNQRFVGCTLWYGPTNSWHEQQMIRTQINDSKYIGLSYEEFVLLGLVHRNYLRNAIQEGDVVLTHYLPTWASVAREYVNQPTNTAYVNNCADIIQSNKPKFWLHGHTHTPCDYEAYDTRVICNATNPVDVVLEI